MNELNFVNVFTSHIFYDIVPSEFLIFRHTNKCTYNIPLNNTLIDHCLIEDKRTGTQEQLISYFVILSLKGQGKILL